MTAQELADSRRLLDLYENLVWLIEEGYGTTSDRFAATRLAMLARSSAAELIAPAGDDD